MIEQFKKLTQEERDILFIAPVLVSVLASSWNHEVSDRQKTEAVAFEHVKTYSANPLLIPYYKEVEKDYKKHFEEIVKKYAPFDDAKREVLKKQINLLNAVIAKLDREFAQLLHTSLKAYADHIKKVDTNSLLMNFIFPIPIPGFTD